MDLSQYTVVDISHLQEADMPADPSLQLPQSDFFGRIGVDGGLHNLEVLSYCVHTGTHMDAPYHVIETGGGIDTVDPLILIGPACVVKLDVPAGSYGITVDDVKAWEEENGEIQSGEAVLFHTGHDALWETDPDEYITNYPYLLPETAQYMVDKGVRYIAMESISPDTTTTESHQILLGQRRRRGRERVQPGGHRGRPLLYHRHLPQLPGCYRRLDPDLGTLSVKL